MIWNKTILSGEAQAETMRSGGHNCVVLPKLSNAIIEEVKDPEDFEKEKNMMSWTTLRRYWRRVYGIILNGTSSDLAKKMIKRLCSKFEL